MDRLAELRERRGLTLRELSKTSGVSPDAINQIELGHRKARPSTLRKLARALEVDIKDFFKDEELTTRPKVAPPLFDDLVEESRAIEERKRRIEREWYQGVKNLDDEGIKQVMKDLVENGEDFGWEHRGQRLYVLGLTLRSREINAPESVKRQLERLVPA